VVGPRRRGLRSGRSCAGPAGRSPSRRAGIHGYSFVPGPGTILWCDGPRRGPRPHHRSVERRAVCRSAPSPANWRHGPPGRLRQRGARFSFLVVTWPAGSSPADGRRLSFADDLLHDQRSAGTDGAAACTTSTPTSPAAEEASMTAQQIRPRRTQWPADRPAWISPPHSAVASAGRDMGTGGWYRSADPCLRDFPLSTGAGRFGHHEA